MGTLKRSDLPVVQRIGHFPAKEEILVQFQTGGMVETELEKTYLLKYFPKGLGAMSHNIVRDVYIPPTQSHPVLRIRRHGQKFEITKKQPVDGRDASYQDEHTIILTKDEYKSLAKVKGLLLEKVRYYYRMGNQTAEIAVFQKRLKGLALVDFEFKTKDELDRFEMPDFCLADVTQEKFAAGGRLCGKKYSDIKQDLDRFGYKKLLFKKS